MTKKEKAGRRDGSLVFYVTSHGFGHLNRTAAVVNRVPADVPVVIRSNADLFAHWRERVTRPVTLADHISDGGAINPPSDSGATDGPATLAMAIERFEVGTKSLDDEATALRENAARVVLCDAPAVPLMAASRAGIPGFLMSNFTWADIYAPYARAAGTRQARQFIRSLRAAYRLATATFRMAPAMRMSWLSPLIDVGMVVKDGRNRRAELRRLIGAGAREKLVYLYLGRYGQSNMHWARIESLAERGIHFLSYHEGPANRIANFHVIPAAHWPGSDLIASSDAIVAKAGYGTVCEAMAAGTPMIYPPRWGFAEFRSLDRALRDWGGGLPISSRDFQKARFEQALDRAFAIERQPPPFPANGADQILEHVLPLVRP
jgi:hypothetical protein